MRWGILGRAKSSPKPARFIRIGPWFVQDSYGDTIINQRRLDTRRRVRLGALLALALAIAATLAAGCQQNAPAASTSTAPPAPTAAPAPTTPANVERRPVPGGPLLLRDDIALRKVVDVPGGSIRLARSPADGELYLLHPGKGLLRVKPSAPAAPAEVASVSDMVGDAVPAGMAFGPAGTLYVVADKRVSNENKALIRRGVPAAGRFTWSTLAETERYPLSDTPFDHLFNGIAASDDGKWVFVNSGSRTDHGEVESNHGGFPNLREIPLTSAIFRLPADAQDLRLPNDEAALKPYLFADGTRNAYDLAFAPNGDLFAVDNGPDADYPDELNWLREGLHYGFPWRFGDQDNPQRAADYDPAKDKRLQPDYTAVQNGTYRNDPSFPQPPGPFTDPVANAGPAAAQYRADDGSQRDAAAEQRPLRTFTPHRSPLGLVFASDAKMPADMRGQGDTLSALLLSWGAAGGTLSDRGQDLLHLALTKRGDHYEATTTQIAREFKQPIDAVLVENRLYVLEYGDGGAIWELTFGK